MDPAHIAPSRSDANSNGHFPPANGHMPAGTPRGFNLSNFNMNGMAAIPGFGAPGQFPPFLAGHSVQAPMGGCPTPMTAVPAQFEEEVDILANPEPARMIADQEISVGAEKEADLVPQEAAEVDESAVVADGEMEPLAVQLSDPVKLSRDAV